MDLIFLFLRDIEENIELWYVQKYVYCFFLYKKPRLVSGWMVSGIDLKFTFYSKIFVFVVGAWQGIH